MQKTQLRRKTKQKNLSQEKKDEIQHQKIEKDGTITKVNAKVFERNQLKRKFTHEQKDTTKKHRK